MGHPYSDVAAVQQAFGGARRMTQATDWDGDRSADTTVIDNAIALADAEIDSYLNKQFRVPLDTVPPLVKNVSAILAKHRLLSPRGMVDEQTKQDREDVIKWLEGVRDGLNAIGVEPVPDPASMRIDASSARPTSKEVSRFKLRGFS